jgi:hypothetical protein
MPSAKLVSLCGNQLATDLTAAGVWMDSEAPSATRSAMKPPKLATATWSRVMRDQAPLPMA